ncbi:30S ribosomal protein S2 [Mycolicibacterium conceptionense]|uniref:Multifunctional fusion protein n=1 Tax=Mycolicibacterium conceptionense TaxID=451644 RepID=A0A0U1DY39_9MYCO|nr:30S ribosomal protein S2 [Mycolicibacterium conceptionense]
MAVVTMKQLLDSGAHFGHQTRRWNPKMKRFIFTDRNGIYIIDLQQTLTYIDKAYEFVKETVAHGGTILFVGTKKQAQESIAEEATRVGMPYVNQRWLGGMLTNFSTVHKRLQRLKELEAMEQTGGFEGRTKKEILMLTREKNKLERSLGGIRDMQKVPSAIWVVDTNKEHLAVNEAIKLGIPVIAILDTNCDPDQVNYPIPGNDDAIRSAALLTKVVASAVARACRPAPARVPARSRTPKVPSRWPSGSRNCWPEPPQAPPRVTPPLRPKHPLTLPDFFSSRRVSYMANYTAADVKRLRELTGSGMMDCKNALAESDGDFDKAVELLRIKGAKDVGKRAERATAEGLVAAKDGALIELNSETDFVAKNAEFQELANQVVAAAAAAKVSDADALKAAKVGDTTVEQAIADLSAKIGEKLELRRAAYFDGTVETYLHKRAADLPPAVGVLVEYTAGDADKGKEPPTRSPCRSPRSRPSTSPVRTSRPTSSPTSDASPRRPRRRRASPSRRCPRSSKVASRASTRTSCCWTSRRCLTTRRPSRHCWTRPASP